MSLGLWLLLSIYLVSGEIIQYLYRRSKKDGGEKRNDRTNDTGTVDPADAGLEHRFLPA